MVIDFRHFIWWINLYSKNILVMSQFYCPSQSSPGFYRIRAYEHSISITTMNQAIHFPSCTLRCNFWVLRHAWQTVELFWNAIVSSCKHRLPETRWRLLKYQSSRAYPSVSLAGHTTTGEIIKTRIPTLLVWKYALLLTFFFERPTYRPFPFTKKNRVR